MAVRFIFFLNSANLICRGTGISKYFRESLGLQDNESRLDSKGIVSDGKQLSQDLFRDAHCHTY